MAQESWHRRPSGLYQPTDMERPRRVTPPLLAFDAFCGAGGFSLGFLQAGDYQVVGALDQDPHAALTYLYNLGADQPTLHFATPGDEAGFAAAVEQYWQPQQVGGIWQARVSGANRPAALPGVAHFFLGDVRAWSGSRLLTLMGLELGDLTVLMGGPPCQGFSTAGKRQVLDPRNNLVFEFARLVIEMQPATMVLENVPGLASMTTPEGLPVIDALCRVLEDGGFAGFNALRRGLQATAGVGAGLRRPPQRPAPQGSESAGGESPTAPPPAPPTQTRMF